MAVFNHSPKSGHIKSVVYDDHSRHIAVTFQHDRQPEPKVYTHTGVPLDVFHAYLKWMKDGQSAGSYYHRFIARYPQPTNSA